MGRRLFAWAFVILAYWLVVDTIAYLLGFEVSGVYWVFDERHAGNVATETTWTRHRPDAGILLVLVVVGSPYSIRALGREGLKAAAFVTSFPVATSWIAPLVTVDAYSLDMNWAWLLSMMYVSTVFFFSVFAPADERASGDARFDGYARAFDRIAALIDTLAERFGWKGGLLSLLMLAALPLAGITSSRAECASVARPRARSTGSTRPCARLTRRRSAFASQPRIGGKRSRASDCSSGTAAKASSDRAVAACRVSA